MHNGTDLIYSYDGTFDGLLCCVFECYEKKEMPCGIHSPENDQLTLCEVREIITDTHKAERVKKSLKEKVYPKTYYDIELCFLSCNPDKDLVIVKFIIMSFKFGATVYSMLADNTVNALFTISKNVSREAHYYKEFLRFSVYNGVLVSVIEPKNIVLPLIKHHYSDRLNSESFMIFDKTHQMALTYSKKRTKIFPVEELELPEADEEEIKYRNLWKQFYNTIGIKERYNPKCRMNLMPKRYWKQLTEYSELIK